MKLRNTCFSLPQFPCLDGIFGGWALLFLTHEDRGCHKNGSPFEQASDGQQGGRWWPMRTWKVASAH